MERYSEITNNIKREIVLLKARPCAWSKCSFCDYIEDNTTCTKEMLKIKKCRCIRKWCSLWNSRCQGPWKPGCKEIIY